MRYSTSDPKDAQVVTFTDFWKFPPGALVVGVVALVFAAKS